MAEFSVKQIGEGEEREYAVLRDGEAWLQIALTPTSYAIGWPGTTIENLDQAVRREIPRHADIPRPAAFDVRIITQEPREYTELHLPNDARPYRNILRAIERVSFIRYDNHIYSFTAAYPSSAPELAVQLNRNIPLSTSLTSWILEHHRNPEMNVEDFQQLFRTIE